MLVASVRVMEVSMAFTFDFCSSDACDLLLLLLLASVRMEIVHDSSSSDNTVSIPSADLFCTKH